MPKPVTTVEPKVTPDPKLEKKYPQGLYSRVQTINHQQAVPVNTAS